MNLSTLLVQTCIPVARFFVNTALNPRIRRTPTHVIFSRVAPDLSHRVRKRCVSQNSHSSHLAQHVTRALVVVSFTLEHYFTFHLHSNPTFWQTFIDVNFTRRFTLRRSIESVFRPPGCNALAYISDGQRGMRTSSECSKTLECCCGTGRKCGVCASNSVRIESGCSSGRRDHREHQSFKKGNHEAIGMQRGLMKSSTWLLNSSTTPECFTTS